jgi:hypothetical protein
MEFTFNSKSLEREVSLHQIYELTPSEARNLHAELVIAVQSMDEKVSEALASEHASGIPADKDWIHRVKKKRRICVAFATQVKQMLDAPQQQAAPVSNFTTIFQRRFEELLLEELGQTVFDEIKAEARDLALADLQVPVQGA